MIEPAPSPKLTLAAVLAVASLASTFAAPIEVPNASFEARDSFEPFADSIDKYPKWALESWRHFEVDNNGGPLRIWNPGSANQLDGQGALDIGFDGEAPDGDYVILVRSRYNDDEFHDPPQPRDFEAAVQLLDATFDPSKSYTLTAKVGQPPGSDNYTPDWFGYSLQLAVGGTNVDGATFAGRVEGGTVIAEDHNSQDVPIDTWETATVTYTPDPAHADLAGQPLQIRLAALEDPADHSLTGWVAFDDVTLESGSAGPTYIPVDISSTGDGLVIDWASQSGKLYNLMSSTDLAVWVPIESDIPAIPKSNSRTLPQPASPSVFYRVEEFPKPPVTVTSEKFDAGPGLPAGWTTGTYPADSGTTVWQLGSPAGGPGPAAATSGTSCMGTNLTTKYGISSDTWLRSAPVDLSAATGAEITFQHWVDMDNFDRGDIGTVRVLEAAGLPGSVTELGVVRTNIQGLEPSAWKTFSRNLPAAALGKSVVIEFRFVSDPVNVDDASGWYLDDFAIDADLP